MEMLEIHVNRVVAGAEECWERLRSSRKSCRRIVAELNQQLKTVQDQLRRMKAAKRGYAIMKL